MEINKSNWQELYPNAKGILFSTPMVRAIREGKKTQTRRAIKTPSTFKSWNVDIDHAYDVMQSDLGDEFSFLVAGDQGWTDWSKNPYGKTGDILYVRETFQHTKVLNINPEDENYGYVYKEDGQPWEDFEGWKWKPSLFMPKDACRILLKIKSIRAEKLHEMPEDDALNEGIIIKWNASVRKYMFHNYTKDGEMDCICYSTPKNAFSSLWERINGKDSWKKNPWVWVIEFEPIML